MAELDDILGKAEVSGTIDVMELLKTSLQEDNSLAKEFNDRVVPYLARQIRDGIRVNSTTVDTGKVGDSIIDTLITGTKTSVKNTVKVVGDSLAKIKPDTFNISAMFEGDKKFAEQFRAGWKQNQKDLADKFTKIIKGVKLEKVLTNGTMTIPDMLGIDDKDRKECTKLFSDLRTKIREIIKSTKIPAMDAKEPAGTKIPAMDAKEPAGTKSEKRGRKWESQIDHKQQVIIMGMSPEAEKSLGISVGKIKLNNIINIKNKDNKFDWSWFLNINPFTWLKRLALVSGGLIIGGLTAGIYSIFSDGPFRDIGLIFSRISIPLGLRLAQTTIKLGKSLLIRVGGYLYNPLAHILDYATGGKIERFSRILNITKINILKKFDSLFTLIPQKVKEKMISFADIFENMFAPVNKIFKPIEELIRKLGASKSFISPKLASTIDGITTFLSKKAGPQALSKINLKNIPLLGLFIGLGAGLTKIFKFGDLSGGINEITSGMLSIGGPVGSAASWLMLGYEEYRQLTTTPEQRAKQSATGSIIGFKLTSRLVLPVLTKLGLRRLPIIGGLFNLADAKKEYDSGDAVKGTFSLISGLASLTGGGALLSLPLDAFNWLIAPKEERIAPGGTFMRAGWHNFVNNTLTKTPGIKQFISLAKGLTAVLTGNWKYGFTELGKTVPFVGSLVEILSEAQERAELPSNKYGAKLSPFKIIQNDILDNIKRYFKNASWILKKVLGYFGIDFGKVEAESIDIAQEATTEVKKGNIFGGIKDLIMSRIKKYFKNAPWIVKKALKTFGVDVDVEEDDVQPAVFNKDTSSIDKMQKKARGQDVNVEVKPEAKDAQGMYKRVANKFTIQPVHQNDNMFAMQKGEFFDKTFKAQEQLLKEIRDGIKSNSKDDNTDILVKAVNTMSGDIRSMMQLNARKPSESLPRSTMGPLPSPASDEIRDPAYLLRTKVWRKLREDTFVL